MTYFNKSAITDSLNNEVEVGLFGGLKVSTPTSQISLTFEHPLDEVVEVSTATTGLGTVVSQFNRSLLNIATNGVGTAELQTLTPLRYKTASTIETYFTAQFTGTPGAGDIMQIGLYDSGDGVYIGYQGTDFVVGYRNTNVGADAVQVIDMSAYTLTNLYRYRIRFGYLGIGNISYEIMDGDKWVLLHTFKTDGTLTGRTHVGNPLLPMKAEVSSASNDLQIKSGSWNAQTYGQMTQLQDKPFFSDGTRTVSVNAAEELPVVAFRSKTSFGGYTNKVLSQLLFTEFATGSEGLYKINLYVYPAGTIIDGIWTDIATDRSVLEQNDTTNYNIFTNKVFSKTIAVSSSGTGVGTADVDFSTLGIKALPGQEFLVTKECLVAGLGDDITSWSIAYADLF